VGFAFWFIYGACKGTHFFAKRENPKAKTPKDKFVVTVTVIIFLMYTTMCNQAFSLFSCRRIGKKQYLEADLEEPCYEGQHLAMVLSLGVFQLLVYVIGLPLFVLYFLRRNYASASHGGGRAEANGDEYGVTEGSLFNNPVVVTRWGLFFKG
jgi:hypothetical protein